MPDDIKQVFALLEHLLEHNFGVVGIDLRCFDEFARFQLFIEKFDWILVVFLVEAVFERERKRQTPRGIFVIIAFKKVCGIVGYDFKHNYHLLNKHFITVFRFCP